MHILLVEDAAPEAELLELALRAAGIRVTRAHSDLGAYELLARGTPFDALVADLNLGFGTTGFEVAQAARRQFPHMPVLYITGEKRHAMTTAADGAVIIEKAYRPSLTVAALLRHLRGG